MCARDGEKATVCPLYPTLLHVLGFFPLWSEVLDDNRQRGQTVGLEGMSLKGHLEIQYREAPSLLGFQGLWFLMEMTLGNL